MEILALEFLHDLNHHVRGFRHLRHGKPLLFAGVAENFSKSHLVASFRLPSPNAQRSV